MNWLQRLLKNENAATEIIDWNRTFYQPVYYIGSRTFQIGDTIIRGSSLVFEFFEHTIEIDTSEFSEALQKYGKAHPLHEGLVPQATAVIYDVTNDFAFMSPYFPITKNLDQTEIQRFHDMVSSLLSNPNFAISVWDTHGKDFTESSPASLKAIVAGHIIEIFFYRDDLLSIFFSEPRYFNIYINSWAYQQADSIAGGCYDPKTQSIKLVASRLYEGFYGPTPGVAPFIHEFGHMLDAFDIATRKMGRGRGLLPGMLTSDGEYFSPQAREQFLKGKQIEQDRYENARREKPDDLNLIPLGNPYVFQSDGEFIAGYLEMFFRNPNRFAELNPTLFHGFSATFKQDPREYWEKDFDYYVKENHAVYLGHRQGISPSRLKVFS